MGQGLLPEGVRSRARRGAKRRRNDLDRERIVADRQLSCSQLLGILLVGAMACSPIARNLSFSPCRCDTCPAISTSDHSGLTGDHCGSSCCSVPQHSQVCESIPPRTECCCTRQSNAAESQCLRHADDATSPSWSVDKQCRCGCLEGLPASQSEPTPAQIANDLPELGNELVGTSVDTLIQFSAKQPLRPSLVLGIALSPNERCARFCRWLI